MSVLKDSLWFTEQFQHLHKSGLGCAESLTVLAGSAPQAQFAALIYGVLASVKKGRGLSRSLGRYSHYFNEHYVAMIQIGEITGCLNEVLEALLHYQQLDLKVRESLRSAFAYPILTMSLMLIMLVFMFIFIIPQFRPIFDEAHTVLPVYTRALFALSFFMKSDGGMILLFMLIVFFLFKKMRGAVFKRLQFRFVLIRLPVLGAVYHNWLLFVFFSALALGVRSGLSMQQSFKLMFNLFHLTPFESILQSMQYDLEQGLSLEKVFDRREWFPPICRAMFMVAEAGGGLDTQLHALADYFQKNLNQKIESFRLWLEPSLLLLSGFVVGGVVLGLYQPLFQLGGAL